MSERSAKALGISSSPHLVDPSGTLGGYFTDPPGALVRFLRPARGTGELARWLVDCGLSTLYARFPNEGDLRVIMDMREMIGRSAMARSVLMEASKRSVQRIKHVVLLPSLHMGSAYLTVIETSAVALRMMGYRVEIEHDLEHALEKHGVRLQAVSEVRPALPVAAPRP